MGILGAMVVFFFLASMNGCPMLFVLLPPVLGKLIDATKNKKAEEVGKERDHLLY